VNYVAWAPNEPSFANDENCVIMSKGFGESNSNKKYLVENVASKSKMFAT